MKLQEKDNIKEKSELKVTIIQALNTFLSQYLGLAIAFLIIIFFVAWYFFLVKPQYNKILNSISEITEAKESEFEDLGYYYAELQRYVNSYDKISKTDIEKINFMLPEDSGYEQLYTDFESLINGQGLILNSLSIKRDSAEATSNNRRASTADQSGNKNSNVIGEIEITANIIGVNYESLLNTLRLIETNLRIMDIERVDWSPDSLTLSLQITTYYLK